MAKTDQNDEDIKIRLIIRKNEDKSLFDAFNYIKKYMASKLNTEVTRFCIQRTFDLIKEDES